MDWWMILAASALAYLIGSFPTGYLLGRLHGVNVLEQGSGRTGGTNVLRSVGAMPALLTAGIDIGKGALAVWLARQLTGQPTGEVLAGIAVILGHNHSLFLRFRGGAGVGTSMGALAVIYWPAAVALVILMLIIVAITRYASLGSLIITTLTPLILLVLASLGMLSWMYVGYGLIAWIIIVLAHRPNIRRLLQGTERRVGGSA